MKYRRWLVLVLVTFSFLLLYYLTNIIVIPNPIRIVMLIIIIIIGCLLFNYYDIKFSKNLPTKITCYDNLDFIRYLFAIIIIILHLRPFITYSTTYDFIFNNVISRVCVPFYFLLSGYLVGTKSIDNPNYLSSYLKNMLKMYLLWSLIYLPLGINYITQYLPAVKEFIINNQLPQYLAIFVYAGFFIISLLIGLCYLGTYYHLWYFPALMLALVIIRWWKKHLPLKYLLAIGLILLIFGASETYFGFLPTALQEFMKFYYYNIFLTTKNVFFFGLFYVTLGYFLATHQPLFIKHSVIKLGICLLLLIGETQLLKPTDRLNSNILFSAIPFVYYLFYSAIYLPQIYHFNLNDSFRSLSKYYYLVHPWIIVIVGLFITSSNLFFLKLIIVITLTHLVSIYLINLKARHPHWLF